jgi:16S rRNA (guanine(527)-N(7))-methyltransferase RsmG
VTRIKTLEAQLEEFGLHLTDSEIESLLRYVLELERWNRTINLTTLKGTALLRRLVVEPIWVLDQLSPRGRYIDIGSGNGSPAIPWHIRGGFVAVDLVEARTRRSTFLRQITRHLGLERVTVHRGRFEALATELQPAHWITLQGVRLTGQLMEKIRPKVPRTMTAVWFTKAVQPPVSPARVLEIPFSDRRALVFHL